MRKPAPWLILLLLLAVCFSLATVIQPRTYGWTRRTGSDNVLKVLLGDGRKLFANHFFVQADVFFHSGYYPSIFDKTQAPRDSKHMTAEEGSTAEEEHERQMAFMGTPRDWIEKFGRHFLISEHTHLEGGNEREILPWLKLSAELDPQRIETYTVSSYWLRKRLGKVDEAEAFLREGIRNNPNSYELLQELGKLYYENRQDTARARNLWELALRRWQASQPALKSPDNLALEDIVMNLARVEQESGNWQKAIGYLEQARAVSPNPDAIERQIEELKKKPESEKKPVTP